MRKFIKMFTFALMLIISLSVISPAISYAATGSGGIDDVQVNINNGQLTITGGTFSDQNPWNAFISKYKNFIVGVSGIGAVTMLGIFIFMFLKLGASAGNPSARSQALAGILWSGIATAGLGSVAIIVGFFYNAFK